jgi:hypothetical protein
MPEKCRVGICGYDPVLVRGYVGTGARALWWHISDEVYEELDVQPGDKVSGTLHAIYNGEGEQVATPNESFTWSASAESGLAILLPPEAITTYELTKFHFLELTINKIGKKDVAPGEERMSKKWWPDEKMKLAYKVGYIAP